MKLLTGLLKLMVALAGNFFKFFSVKNRVVFSSYFSTRPQGNMKLILNELKKSDIEIIHNFNKYSTTLTGKINYALHMLKELYYFNTCRVVVLDGNSFVLSSINKKDAVKVIQLWHATGAFKKFGNDTERLYPIQNLDYAITSSKHLKPIYAKAFNVPLANVLPLGVPRLDPLFDRNKVNKYRTEILTKHKELRNKKVILYAPTFRGKGAFDIQTTSVDLTKLAQSISAEYVIAIRMHPLMADYSDYKQFVDLSNEDLIKTLCATDLLITDYSSIIFEYSVLERPMLFFVPDLKQYLDNRGFYEDYETFVPGKICGTEEELITSIVNKDFEQEKVKPFRAKYLVQGEGSSAERIAAFIESLVNAKQF